MWENKIALRGVEASMGWKELATVTIKKIHKESTNIRQPEKTKPTERILLYQE